ncbi:MAG: ATP-binding cassette domain-containing protein [Spirochaetales bacterium]|nr:ATP-binding cassette domain-containing protein [Spirochaetales bacterium]
MVNLEHVNMIFNQGTLDENHAIKKINLTIHESDFITIIGSNGAGKTTLFNLIAGSFRPTSGKIFINKHDVTRVPEHKRARYIGRIFQNPLLGTASNMSIEDNMMMCYDKGFKWPLIRLSKKMRSFFKAELSKLNMNLEERMKENVRMLSGGQRQALTLLMMVMSKPTLILLDEHTAALDPKNAALVLSMTNDFIEENKLTTIMITHNMSQAIEFGNRLLMMDEGEIILDVQGKVKRKLTIEKLVKKFHEIRKHDFESDEIRLA